MSIGQVPRILGLVAVPGAAAGDGPGDGIPGNDDPTDQAFALVAAER